MPAPDGIAVDWIADNLYWTDADTNKVEVARLDGRYRRVVVSSNLQQPRAIALYPQNGYAYCNNEALRGTSMRLSKITSHTAQGC